MVYKAIAAAMIQITWMAASPAVAAAAAGRSAPVSPAIKNAAPRPIAR